MSVFSGKSNEADQYRQSKAQNFEKTAIACIAHKSLKICEQSRLRGVPVLALKVGPNDEGQVNNIKYDQNIAQNGACITRRQKLNDSPQNERGPEQQSLKKFDRSGSDHRLQQDIRRPNEQKRGRRTLRMSYKYEMRKSITKQQQNAAEHGHERKSSADPAYHVMEHRLKMKDQTPHGLNRAAP